MKNKILFGVALCGILLISAVMLNLNHPLASMIGAAVKSIPYVVTAVISNWTSLSKKLSYSLALGLGIYLVIDTYITYYAIRHPESSTDSIAALIILLASIIIIPLGSLSAYLLLSLVTKARDETLE